MSFNSKQLVNAALLILSSLWLASCDTQLETDSVNNPETPLVPAGPALADSEGKASNDNLALQIGTGEISLTEGAGEVRIPVQITRNNSAIGAVNLTANGQTSADDLNLNWRFEKPSLTRTEQTTNLFLSLDIDTFPISSHTRTLQVSATSDGIVVLSILLTLQVSPTDKPDIYLLVGQSNTVGFSEANSKQAQAGEPDEPNSRILQLNVTGNDDQNFPAEANFTQRESLYNTGQPLTIAVDPLHDGYNSSINGKAGDRIGFGLSFAKQALPDTSVDIYLVPAAWSDTGFCKRNTNRFPGMGWNATPKSSTALSGTLLHDRAVTRTNFALAETNGILRGILWHQGEADSDNAECAQLYAENIAELATSLRSNINPDARGSSARGIDSDVPFIVGTMSKGTDAYSTQLPFSPNKTIVDAVHRNIATYVNMSDFVNNDDLIPTDYPCGEGSCIHFGAAAYREMGSRYYEKLIGLKR